MNTPEFVDRVIRKYYGKELHAETRNLKRYMDNHINGEGIHIGRDYISRLYPRWRSVVNFLSHSSKEQIEDLINRLKDI